MYQIENNAKNTTKFVVTEVFKAVTSTMGPDGRLAIISQGTAAKTTKDGVTVAKAMKFPEEAQEYVNRVLTEPALKTAIECGDGTTTTIFLTKYLFDIFNNYPSFYQHRQIEMLGESIIESLSQQTIDINAKDNPELLYSLALTSSNSDERIARSVVKAFTETENGFPEIELKQGVTENDIITCTNGLPLNMYFSNATFSKGGTGETTQYTSMIPIVIDKVLRFTSPEEPTAMLTALKSIYEQSETVDTPICIICRGCEHEVINLLAGMNSQVGGKVFIGLQADAGGSIGTELLGDIATVLNTPLLTDVSDIPNNTFLRYEGEFSISNERTVLKDIGDDVRERIAKRIERIEEVIAASGKSRHNFRVKFNEKRIRDLRGELITIAVGGSTESDVKERYDRFEDVVEAVKSALTNGILPGIGHALRVASIHLNDLYRNDENIHKGILSEMIAMCHAQYLKLMSTSLTDEQVEKYVDMLDSGDLLGLFEEFQYVNLATGKSGMNPQDLDVYDTAFASITALKGGVKTAKILATTETILLGNKLDAVSFQTR